MNRIKEFFLYNKRLILGVFIHAGLMWASLAVAYSSYKKYIRWSIHTVPVELKIAIRSTFPWAILIFAALYVLYGMGRDKKGDYPTSGLYVVMMLLYTLSVNLIFFSKGTSVLIVLNLSSIYFVLLLLIWRVILPLIWRVVKIPVFAEVIIPTVVFKALSSNMPNTPVPTNNVTEYLKEKPSALFLIGFMSLLILCAFLLIFKQKKAAENLASIAYFLLVIGIGIEIYYLMKQGEKGE